jgi:Fe-S-cluster containining protein
MAEGTGGGDPQLAAGDFSSWLKGVEPAIRGEGGSDVPCGGCTACCTSSQFVHIGPDEVETLARTPAELLFPAPGAPPGHVLLGYDERGHCPMLVDDRCSIYEHRPRTCRSYDCRVFPAAGLEPEGDDKRAISRRVRQWRFGFPTPADQAEHDAVGAAATFLGRHRGAWPEAPIPGNATQLAVLAIEVHGSFLGRDEETGAPTLVEPDPDEVRVEVRRRRGPALDG